MNTVTYTASLYDQRNTSTWATGYARQGKYTTTMHRGLIVFPELANNAMRGKQISDIGLTLVASSSGYGSSYTKNATFYTTSKTEASGTSTSWIAKPIRALRLPILPFLPISKLSLKTAVRLWACM